MHHQRQKLNYAAIWTMQEWLILYHINCQNLLWIIKLLKLINTPLVGHYAFAPTVPVVAMYAMTVNLPLVLIDTASISVLI